MADNWTTIESDPGVFTELIERMQTKGIEVVELWDTSKESLTALEPVYGLIFLFKYEKDAKHRIPDPTATQKGIFFASQVIQNACATQALINILFNTPENSPGFDLGPELSQLKAFIADFDYQMKGLAIGNSNTIRTIHNSFHPPEPLIPDEDDEEKTPGDAFHFIGYVPAADGLYELDGLQEGPLRLCDCKKEEWLTKAADAINERIATRYSASEQRFNLMAVVRSRLDVVKELLSQQEALLGDATGALHREQPGSNEAKKIEDEIDVIRSTVMEMQSRVMAEKEKRRKWSEENVRRRTDMTPLVFHLLKELAMEGVLEGLVEQAANEKQTGS